MEKYDWILLKPHWLRSPLLFLSVDQSTLCYECGIQAFNKERFLRHSYKAKHALNKLTFEKFSPFLTTSVGFPFGKFPAFVDGRVTFVRGFDGDTRPILLFCMTIQWSPCVCSSYQWYEKHHLGATGCWRQMSCILPCLQACVTWWRTQAVTSHTLSEQDRKKCVWGKVLYF